MLQCCQPVFTLSQYLSRQVCVLKECKQGVCPGPRQELRMSKLHVSVWRLHSECVHIVYSSIDTIQAYVMYKDEQA